MAQVQQIYARHEEFCCTRTDDHLPSARRLRRCPSRPYLVLPLLRWARSCCILPISFMPAPLQSSSQLPTSITPSATWAFRFANGVADPAQHVACPTRHIFLRHSL